MHPQTETQTETGILPREEATKVELRVQDCG